MANDTKGEAIKALAAANGRLCTSLIGLCVGFCHGCTRPGMALGHRNYFRNAERAQWVTHILETMCEHGLDLSVRTIFSLLCTALDVTIFWWLQRLGLT